ECYEYEGRGMTLKSYEDARKVLVNLNPGQKLTENQAPAQECDTVGDHWNFYAKGKFKGSVLGCECCRNTDAGPGLEKRYKAHPN
ncbi:MAG: hypothetical protein L0Y32_05745, partial [Nevskiales bacterium]|nr:hypothetical protein [Nevskiales bacterium]